jgi:hypothetical protein
MVTITEDYVSFETAKLLKEKGFDEPCYMAYVPTNRKHIMRNDAGHSNSMHPDDYYAVPTLQMAMKWLREVYNLFVFPFPQMNTNKFWVEIYQLSDNQEWENLYCESIDLQDYSTYEEACEAAIKYCLENLI